jgi:hypothetical protein
MLNTIQCGLNVRLAVDTTTGESGLQFRVQIAEAVVKGSVLAVSAGADNKYIKQTVEFDCCAIAYEAGAQDSYIWAWTTGAICQVLYKVNTASTRGWVAVADADDGFASDIDIASIGGNPATTAHFKEIGHVKQTLTAGGAGVSNLVLIHFHTL